VTAASYLLQGSRGGDMLPRGGELTTVHEQNSGYGAGDIDEIRD
jgi:hypothetical protein